MRLNNGLKQYLMRNKNLDASRGIAAFIVLLYHLPMVFKIEESNIFIEILLYPTKFGEQSVYYFMLLSGFVLTLAFQKIEKIQKYSSWFVWRNTRLLIVYYTALIMAALLISNKNLRIVDFTHFYIFSNKDIYSGINPPLWSLSVEIIISLVLFPIIKSTNAKSDLFSILLIFFLIFGSYFTNEWGIKGLCRSAALFIIGILICKYIDFLPKLNFKLSFVLVFLWSLLIAVPKLLNLAMYISLPIILLFFIQNKRNLLVNRFTLLLGKYSFSLYATHWVVLSVSYSILNSQNKVIIYFVTILLSLSSAVLFGKLVEFPAKKLARAII